VRRNGWFRYCRPRGGTDLAEQIVLLKARKQFVDERIADLKRLLATPGSTAPEVDRGSVSAECAPSKAGYRLLGEIVENQLETCS
jgi:hypothetical protein